MLLSAMSLCVIYLLTSYFCIPSNSVFILSPQAVFTCFVSLCCCCYTCPFNVTFIIRQILTAFCYISIFQNKSDFKAYIFKIKDPRLCCHRFCVYSLRPLSVCVCVSTITMCWELLTIRVISCLELSVSFLFFANFL